ncbi:MAG: hypothetical protein WBV91_19605, partial [Desulfobacterales bacterium]
ISQFITGLRYVTVALRGEDLKNMGLKPGPIFRETLRSVLNAKLNGRLITKHDEIQFVRRYLQQTPTPSRPDGGP